MFIRLSVSGGFSRKIGQDLGILGQPPVNRDRPEFFKKSGHLNWGWRFLLTGHGIDVDSVRLVTEKGWLGPDNKKNDTWKLSASASRNLKPQWTLRGKFENQNAVAHWLQGWTFKSIPLGHLLRLGRAQGKSMWSRQWMGRWGEPTWSINWAPAPRHQDDSCCETRPWANV